MMYNSNSKKQMLADEDDEILQSKNKVYDALMDNKSSEAVSIFLEVWDKVKKYKKCCGKNV